MREPNQEELRTGDTLERGQGGARFMPFSGSHYLRHAQITTWWELVLGVLGLAFAVVALVNLVLRNP